MNMMHGNNQGTKTFTPRLIFWELTEGCNLKCKHCRATAQPQRNKDELSTEEAYEIINQIAEHYHPILVLTGGEPLYRPDIFEIASYAKKKGLTIALASNGTLITPEIAQHIRDVGFDRVAISIDGACAATHDSFRGIPGAFEAALRGARNLTNVGVPFQFNTTITKNDVNELEEIVQLSLREGAAALHLFMLVPVGCGVQIADEMMLPADEYERVLRWFYEQSQIHNLEIKATCAPHYYRIMRQVAKERGEKITFETHGMSAVTKGCLAGTAVAFISHKGEVRPCGYMPLTAGDLKEQDFHTIWTESELFATLRDPNKLEGKCGVCEYINVCSGCRARALAETGNVVASEPYCIYQPKRWEETSEV
ncbi:radical SAM/SPASM domain-containing protein [Rubeoparvulum massiliense]|uniref:radical SAM/SPASM domain-containing protein n=1 Tax=Rubeoparvulum massiliense TaxID=1631346 RepID=UPI00065E839A|nr:radical SAM protein [Rubeoparvulum massiliense]